MSFSSLIDASDLSQAFAIGYQTVQPTTIAAWRTARIVKILDESPSIRSFVLSPTDGKPFPRYKAGQYIRLRVPDSGLPIRCYTLSDLPHPRQWRITVKRQQSHAGSVSNHLHAAPLGTAIELSEPAGTFHVDRLSESKHLFLYAAGVGITPIFVIAAALACRTPRSLEQVTLAYQVSDWSEIVFRRELQSLVAGWPKIKLQLAISRPPREDDRPAWLALHRLTRMGVEIFAGRRTCERLAAQTVPDAGCRIVACGPAEWMNQVRECLRIRGHSDDAILMESFGGYLPEQSDGGSTSSATEAAREQSGYTVKIGDDERTYRFMNGDGTLLEQMLRQGVGMSSGCRKGECDACICRLRSGQVQYLAQTRAQLQPGWILPCVATAASNLELELT